MTKIIIIAMAAAFAFTAPAAYAKKISHRKATNSSARMSPNAGATTNGSGGAVGQSGATQTGVNGQAGSGGASGGMGR